MNVKQLKSKASEAEWVSFMARALSRGSSAMGPNASFFSV